MKQLITTFFVMSGICYGQTTYSALVICDSINNRISIETDSTFTITKDKSKVHIYGDTMACIILMAQEIQRLSDDMRREKSIGQFYNWNSIALETQKKLDRNESIVDSISRMKVLNAIKLKENSIIKRCEERGHIISQGVPVTLAYCPPYLIETDSTTIKVYPICNWADDYCERCGKHFPSSQKEVREIIWKKENK